MWINKLTRDINTVSMVRPPWQNSTSRNNWLRPSAFHQYQVWPQQPHPQEQSNPFSQYSQIDVGHYINPNIVQPTVQNQRVTAMKLEISPELPIQPSIQGNKLFVAVPGDARTIGEFKEHVAAMLNVSSSVFHFTTGEFRIPDEEVIGILSCITDQRISVVRSVRMWPVSEAPSRTRFPAQHLESSNQNPSAIESPASRLSRLRSPPRLTHPLPCRPPRISPKHVPISNSSHEMPSDGSVNLPAAPIPMPMSFSQMKYRVNKETHEDLINERLTASQSTSTITNKRNQESHAVNGNRSNTSSAAAAAAAAAAVGHSSRNHRIPVAVDTNNLNENELQQSQSSTSRDVLTPEIQESCTVYAAATGDTSGKLTLLYCETINDNATHSVTHTLPGTTIRVPTVIESMPKEKSMLNSRLNGSINHWNGIRINDSSETTTSAFASISTSNSPLNLSSVAKTFGENDNNSLENHHVLLQQMSSDGDQRHTLSSLSQLNNNNNNNNSSNIFRSSRSSFVFGSTSPLVGSSFRSIAESPSTSVVTNDLTSSTRNKHDLFGAASTLLRTESVSTGSSRITPWNLYRTFGSKEPESSKTLSAAASLDSVSAELENTLNGEMNSAQRTTSRINLISPRSPGIIATKRRRICAIDSASLVYLHASDKIDNEGLNGNETASTPSSSFNSASTSKHAQKTPSEIHGDEHGRHKGTDNFRIVGNNHMTSCGSQTQEIFSRREKNDSSYRISKNGKKSHMFRAGRAKHTKNSTTDGLDAHSTLEDNEQASVLQKRVVAKAVGSRTRVGVASSNCNNLILEDIESEDTENEFSPLDEDGDIKIVYEIGKDPLIYKEDAPFTRPEEITTGSLIVFNEKIGNKDDCDCEVLSAHRWAKVINVESPTSYMLRYFSPYQTIRSQMKDKKDYVRIDWKDLVDPRSVVVTKGPDEDTEAFE